MCLIDCPDVATVLGASYLSAPPPVSLNAATLSDMDSLEDTADKGKADEEDRADKANLPNSDAQPVAGAGPGPSNVKGDTLAETMAAQPALHLGVWQALLDDKAKELTCYNTAGSHLAYLQQSELGGKRKGCFLVGAHKETDTKPQILGAGLLLNELLVRL